MLPVGIRYASIINARKKRASIMAVTTHSKVFAISAALFFRVISLELVFSVLLGGINVNPAAKGVLVIVFSKKFNKKN